MRRRPSDHSTRLARGELSDETEVERLEHEAPESLMRRREFLGRTAAAAGVASLAGALPAEQLVAEAARRAARVRLPSPGQMPIDNIVVLMMENRSFDHYFGWHPDADAKNKGLRYPDAEGKLLRTHRLTPDYQGCGHPDPDHGWDGGRWQWHRGRNDRFVTGNRAGTGSDEFAIGYYLAEDLAFLPAVADAYTLYDRWFCSIMASTFPNRHYLWSAQSGGTKSNSFAEDPIEGYTWETIFDRAISRGVSAMYFNSDLPVSGLYGERAIPWTRPISEYYARCATGTLPAITFLDPPFGDIGLSGGGFFAGAVAGFGASDHPHSDARLGQAFIADTVGAFVESPQYRRGAMFVMYDEWGGFFDHVRPPFVPDDRRNRADIGEDFGLTGFRVPGVAISPYSRRGGVSHMTVTHESVLKMISYRFRLGHLNKRHRYASNIARSLDFSKRDFEPPPLPTPPAILATPCALQGEGGGERAGPKDHGMVELRTSGTLERLGFEAPDAEFEQIFRSPDGARKAYESSTSP